VKPLLIPLGHVAIVVLCLLIAAVLNGLFVMTTYSVNGVDITGMSAAAMVQKLRTGPLLATVHVGPWVEFPLPATEVGAFLMPATAGILLIFVYGPGLIWPTAKRFWVRIGLTGALIVATIVLMSQLGGKM
jgi:hypothetical protein